MGVVMKILKVIVAAALSALVLSGCTLLAIADAAGSAVVYGVKTTVNVLDAVTPDIINKK
jgi:outer membrane murein-binding lipoprotein Lpp